MAVEELWIGAYRLRQNAGGCKLQRWDINNL